MERYIDMHCHILPGVDDGAADIAETKEMLKIAYDEGIRCIIATPHHHPHRGHEHPEILKKKLTLVRRAAQEIDDKFRIYLGTEIYFGQDIPEKLERGEVLSMNQRRRVLIEFSPSDNYNYIQQSIQQIQMHGYEVILAHAERYPCLTDDVELAEHIFNMGVDIQVNAGSIIGESGRKIKQFVKTLMDQDMVFGVGTDAHSANRRAPRMKKAAEYVKKKYGEDYMRRIFFSNAATMLRKKKEE
ncbi:MAG: protein tyrosine phosphatase [Faecalicatena sp.]|uniref:CpsB/CapC family capsule biosynthesis tyrosine phosphatase n=1 Tax=Faecalicatena sp. TaxID=2005360 RepID=UPI0025868F57|nr:CpsB/CapC family capsule biosynthesis tyrosine phosphatase [Faecalicatena sp.]MCI6466409.1 protein tyrosine phosphatase [Faecalicatena sp.]MCI7180550.1 protein tyrosine phosphatase [Lachnospiraceae bacterium]MDY5619846.1 CpsB/CapC family capsule biosynthesis tyrosine phosphatase [Lachnospiraceae bacterium]